MPAANNAMPPLPREVLFFGSLFPLSGDRDLLPSIHLLPLRLHSGIPDAVPARDSLIF